MTLTPIGEQADFGGDHIWSLAGALQIGLEAGSAERLIADGLMKYLR
jgi:hypothetical protein